MTAPVPDPRPVERPAQEHEFVQWAEKPDYKWCMAQVPDGPGWLRICRKTREEHAKREASPKCSGCGRKCKRSSVGWACPSCEELEFME